MENSDPAATPKLPETHDSPLFSTTMEQLETVDPRKPGFMLIPVETPRDDSSEPSPQGSSSSQQTDFMVSMSPLEVQQQFVVPPTFNQQNTAPLAPMNYEFIQFPKQEPMDQADDFINTLPEPVSNQIQSVPKSQSPQSDDSAAQQKQSPGEKSSNSAGSMRAFRDRHNVVERRYRENLNSQIETLRKSMTALARQEGTHSLDSAYSPAGIRNLTKTSVIAAATEQIKRAQTENERINQENNRLESQIADLEKLVMCHACPLLQMMGDVNLQGPVMPT